jgi:biopolymer transport protein ExbB/TolQ
LVYIATGLVIGVTALWAFWFLPRLVTHPQAVADGVARSSKVFFGMRLAAVVVLIAYLFLKRRAGRKMDSIQHFVMPVLFYLAVILFFLYDFFVIDEAPYYLRMYRGLQLVATLMLVCLGVDLTAGILAIIARHIRRQIFKRSEGR